MSRVIKFRVWGVYHDSEVIAAWDKENPYSSVIHEEWSVKRLELMVAARRHRMYYPGLFGCEDGGATIGWSVHTYGQLGGDFARSFGDPDSVPVIEQFTGLLDKNGKEIYEGDIVRWEHPMSDIGVVEYTVDDPFAICWPNQCFFALRTVRLGLCYFQGDDVYEVLGNVHENPDLLKP